MTKPPRTRYEHYIRICEIVQGDGVDLSTHECHVLLGMSLSQLRTVLSLVGMLTDAKVRLHRRRMAKLVGSVAAQKKRSTRGARR